METPSCRFSAADGVSVTVTLDGAVYRLSAVKKATYKFDDRFHSKISKRADGFIEVELRPRIPISDLEFLAGEFCNEVLDQDLREDVAEQTDAIRNLLLAHALSQTSLLDRELESADYHADPLGIGPQKAKAPY